MDNPKIEAETEIKDITNTNEGLSTYSNDKSDVSTIESDTISTLDNSSTTEKPDTNVYLSKKDISNLKYNKYEEISKKYNTSYVLLNKKTGLVVEMKAASPLHACNIIGWRPKNCLLLQTKIEETKKDSSNIVNNTTTEVVSEVLEAPKNTDTIV